MSICILCRDANEAWICTAIGSSLQLSFTSHLSLYFIFLSPLGLLCFSSPLWIQSRRQRENINVPLLCLAALANQVQAVWCTVVYIVQISGCWWNFRVWSQCEVEPSLSPLSECVNRWRLISRAHAPPRVWRSTVFKLLASLSSRPSISPKLIEIHNQQWFQLKALWMFSLLRLQTFELIPGGNNNHHSFLLSSSRPHPTTDLESAQLPRLFSPVLHRCWQTATWRSGTSGGGRDEEEDSGRWPGHWWRLRRKQEVFSWCPRLSDTWGGERVTTPLSSSSSFIHYLCELLVAPPTWEPLQVWPGPPGDLCVTWSINSVQLFRQVWMKQRCIQGTSDIWSLRLWCPLKDRPLCDITLLSESAQPADTTHIFS